MRKLRVGLLFGGRSVEHEVSILSARSILGALDRDRYEICPIAVDPTGRWHLGLPGDADAGRLEAALKGTEVSLPAFPALPGESGLVPDGRGGNVEITSDATAIDVIFPIIHGRGGEDGTLQGLLELSGIPYVGSGVLSSAVQMDKDVAKRLLAAAGLPVTPGLTFHTRELAREGFARLAQRTLEALALPVFVKPANSGSSVGITKAHDEAELLTALADAARYDDKLIVEQAIEAREIEVAVLGNDDPEASLPGEIVPKHEFYDYDAKYHDDSTELRIPAEIPEALSERLREMACRAFEVLDAQGLARVDFLVEKAPAAGREPLVFINELNSLPGFTQGSMYPKLWEATGLSYAGLIDRLIELALERAERRSKLVTSYVRESVEGGTAAQLGDGDDAD